LIGSSFVSRYSEHCFQEKISFNYTRYLNNNFPMPGKCTHLSRETKMANTYQTSQPKEKQKRQTHTRHRSRKRNKNGKHIPDIVAERETKMTNTYQTSQPTCCLPGIPSWCSPIVGPSSHACRRLCNEVGDNQCLCTLWPAHHTAGLLGCIRPPSYVHVQAIVSGVVGVRYT